MSSRRQLMMIVAVVFAALAAASVYAFLGKTTATNEANQQLFEVYVLRNNVAKLDSGDKWATAETLDTKKFPVGDLPQGYVSTASKARLDEFKNRLAAYDLRKGQILVDSMLVDKNFVQPQAAQRVAKDMVAISVAFDEVHAVGNNLEAGDYVNILASVSPAEDNPATPHNETLDAVTTVLYQKVKILYIGNQPAPTVGDNATGDGKTTDTTPPAAASGVITFEVPPDAASRIVMAKLVSKAEPLYLELVNPDYTPVAIPNINNGADRQNQSTFVLPKDAGNLTPYADGQQP